MSENEISLYDAKYRHKDVLEITSIPERSLQVWLQRGNIRPYVEQFTEKRGNRLYAPIDIFCIAVIYNATVLTTAKPSQISPELSNIVIERAQELFDKSLHEYLRGFGSDLALPDILKGHRDPVFAGCRFIGGEAVIWKTSASELSSIFRNDNQDNDSFISGSHILIPIDKIIFSTLYKILNFKFGSE